MVPKGLRDCLNHEDVAILARYFRVLVPEPVAVG
jgi:hypothetical protein